ncbi:MAG TPA: hypothetical protein VLG45_02640 [Thermodesulfobacteriota bacterium]|nr:hypothetical protein [Thermodesulfobacteriota bacterium]
MTRKISGYMVAIFLFCSVNVLLAHANGSPQWVTGEVVSIVEKQDNGLLSLKLADGELFSVSSKPSLLEGVEIGDVVTVQVIEGWAQIISIARERTPGTPRPEKKDTGVQWVPGEVVSIQEGAYDSLISVRMSDKTIFNISSPNDLLKGIKVGDHVIVKVFRGWAQSVTKK